MKKSVVVLTLLLIGSIAGTYAVYELYVKQRMRELGEHMEEEKQLTDAITRLEETFYRTKPDVVLRVWREQTQPWANAVARRSEFFNLGDIPLEVEIPEEEIPKFYYKEIYDKMIQILEDEAYQSQTIISDTTFGIPNPSNFGQGTNPKPEEISAYLVRFEFGAAVTRLFIDAGVIQINNLNIWPERNEVKGLSGDIKSRTIGADITISVRDFVSFMEDLSRRDRYFQVKAIRITNRTLRDPDANLNVQMILAQAYYEPATESREVAGAVSSTADLKDLFGSLFGASSTTERKRSKEDGRTWWQNFRKKYLPF